MSTPTCSAPLRDRCTRARCAYIRGASQAGLTPAALDALVAPWLGSEGQSAFYRQIAQADQRHTDEIESRYGDLDLPVLVVWSDDSWIPVDRAHRLAKLIPGPSSPLIDGAGHLVQFDRPAALAAILLRWHCSGAEPSEPFSWALVSRLRHHGPWVGEPREPPSS